MHVTRSDHSAVECGSTQSAAHHMQKAAGGNTGGCICVVPEGQPGLITCGHQARSAAGCPVDPGTVQ